jgi:AcrR family transcriptional regulator
MNTKEKIIRASIELFLTKGFENVSLNQIAVEVGISKPAIYYHYENKDSLIFAIYDYFNDKMTIWSQSYFSGALTPKDFFRRMFDAIIIFSNIEQVLLDKKDTNFPNSYNSLIISFGRYNSEYKKRLSETTIETRNKFERMILSAQKEKIINKNIDPESLALLIHAAIEGLSFMYDTDESIDIKKNSTQVFNLLWKLIAV